MTHPAHDSPVETTNTVSAAERELVAAMQVEDDVRRQLQRHAELLPIASFGATGRFVLGRLRKHPLDVVLMLASTIAAALCVAIVPFLIGRAVDAVVQGTGIRELWFIAGWMVLTGIAGGVLTALSRARISALGQKILAGMREEVIDRAVDLPAQTMERAGIGDALSRVADDVDVTAKAVNNIVPFLVAIGFQVVTTLVAMVMISPWLLVLLVAILPWYGVALRWYLPRTNRIYRIERIAKGARAQGLLAAINGIPTVHAYGIERREVAHVARLSKAAYALTMGIIRLVVKVVWLMNIPEALAIVLLVAIGYALVNADVLPVGLIATAAVYLVALFWPLQALVFSLDDVQSAAASMTRMVGVITSINPATSRGGEVPRDGSISAEGVSHTYGSRATIALHPIDLHVAPGETIALVGASGAGKSTLAAILAGTLEPSHGTVRHGGAHIAHADIEAVRAHASIITQDVHVFHGTLRDDLRLAKADASDEELWQALTLVGAEEWVRLLPQQLDTVVGERGARLTAEQSQLLALARIALQDPAILIMDEATADEGSSGARVLERAAIEVARGRTSVIVAHRLSQAMLADRILVMEHGAVVESGTHTQLLERGGVYANLWAAWSK